MSSYFDLSQAIKDARFKGKADFAQHYGLHAYSVSRWGDDPPKWVRVVLKERAALYDALESE